MPSPRALRLVVQHVSHPDSSVWRIVAYGEGQNLGPLQFGSVPALTTALRRAMPGLAELILAGVHESPETYIAFSGAAELSDTQLAELGLQLQGTLVRRKL
jgi:hypothetical protein